MLLACSVVLAAPGWDGEREAGQARRDLKVLDVCRLVPGDAVAKAVGGALAEARPFFDKDGTLARCTYVVTLPGSGDTRQAYVIWIYPPADFEELKAFTEGKMTAVPGLGDGAYSFQDPGDGRFKVRVLKRGEVTIEATAVTADGARNVAEAAVAAVSKAK